MIPRFDRAGRLPPGIHLATWQEVVNRFGRTRHRQRLLQGLKGAGGMIKNERQYAVTKTQADKFARALEQLRTRSARAARVSPVLLKAEEKALSSQLADLRSELQEYETLRSGERARLKLASLEELPRALIQARIVAGLSQKDL